MIKQLFNSVIAKYRDLSVSHRSILFASAFSFGTDKSPYFAQPRPIIVNYCNSPKNTSLASQAS